MSAKSQHNNILLAIVGFAAVVVLVALIGFFDLGRDPELMQGQVFGGFHAFTERNFKAVFRSDDPERC